MLNISKADVDDMRDLQLSSNSTELVAQKFQNPGFLSDCEFRIQESFKDLSSYTAVCDFCESFDQTRDSIYKWRDFSHLVEIDDEFVIKHLSENVTFACLTCSTKILLHRNPSRMVIVLINYVNSKKRVAPRNHSNDILTNYKQDY